MSERPIVRIYSDAAYNPAFKLAAPAWVVLFPDGSLLEGTKAQWGVVGVDNAEFLALHNGLLAALERLGDPQQYHAEVHSDNTGAIKQATNNVDCLVHRFGSHKINHTLDRDNCHIKACDETSRRTLKTALFNKYPVGSDRDKINKQFMQEQAKNLKVKKKKQKIKAARINQTTADKTARFEAWLTTQEWAEGTTRGQQWAQYFAAFPEEKRNVLRPQSAKVEVQA